MHTNEMLTDEPEPEEPTMTIAEPQTLKPFTPVVYDIYRNIHKGIRAEMFTVVGTAGSLDPADRQGWSGLASEIDRMVTLLEGHAEHEDDAVLPVLQTHLPDLADKIVDDHLVIDARLHGLRQLAEEAVDTPRVEAATRTHRLYLELASFTGAYLEHQDVEERVVMPALEAAVGVDEVIAIEGRIVANIPPAEMADALSLMIPAMNIDERGGFLGGMRDHAPAEVFAGVWGLAGSVLSPADYAALGTRLGL